VSPDAPLTNYGEDVCLRVGRGGCSPPVGFGQVLLGFHLAPISRLAEVTTATLNMHLAPADHVGQQAYMTAIRV
jgi:hypothetical protein